MIRVLHVPVTAITVGNVVEVEQSLDSFKSLLDGGWLEAINGPGWVAYCDEEGKLKGLPVNFAATSLAHMAGWQGGDVLCGPVIFVGPTDEEGDDTSVTSALLDIVGLS